MSDSLWIAKFCFPRKSWHGFSAILFCILMLKRSYVKKRKFVNYSYEQCFNDLKITWDMNIFIYIYFCQSKKSNLYYTRCRDGNRSGRPAPVRSILFDRPVKPVKKPVKFSFFVTKIHINTNQNIHRNMRFSNSLWKTNLTFSTQKFVFCLFSFIYSFY